jgi:predicted signal transduction protein with EAL and GGDEF domain
MGGDEFVILMEDVDEKAQCAALANDLITEISRPMTLRGYEVRVYHP